jgi:hypothetical protein
MGRSLVHAQNRVKLWSATAAFVVHVEQRSGGDRFTAWLVINKNNCVEGRVLSYLKGHLRSKGKDRRQIASLPTPTCP